MAIRFIVVAAVLTIGGSVGLAQSKPSIQGVWRKVEVTVTTPNPNAANPRAKGTHTNEQPGLLIFTAKHYSSTNDNAVTARPRAAFKVQGKPTAEEMQAQWAPFQASAGTYELTGTTITFRPTVAKVPMYQGGLSRHTVKLDGDTLWLKLVEISTNEKIADQPTIKYIRIE